MRKREKIIVAKHVDVPFQKEDETKLCYDSVREFFHNGFQRGEVEITRPSQYRNGLSGQGSDNTTHKIKLFKSEDYETGDFIFWMDGIMPRLLRINSILQDKKSRRHVVLYCTEREYGQSLEQNKNISSFGNPFDY